MCIWKAASPQKENDEKADTCPPLQLTTGECGNTRRNHWPKIEARVIFPLGGTFAAWFVSQTLFFCNLIVHVQRNSFHLTGRDKPANNMVRDATCLDVPTNRKPEVQAFSLGDEMRVLLVPFAAAALFATANYSSATMTDGAAPAAATNVLYADAGYQLPVDMKVPALKAGVKVQISWLESQDMNLQQQVRITR
ncbi:hypothetical protein MOV66_01740 [Agrobacterium sp. SHOUNA12C]|uniref:hypothetical protein n=1 Tax=Rhizobium rhizogenes TaxID=359 RepID=UPI001F1F3DC4|nr:hypothetical protein [Rhizobium rhizogenes]MCJ9719710.1 hypothetical protein [Agrobacterium sp. BETTINA12B]MCJ9755355.1 hypothetical protein [Agrobacterium sp. SHOUNA12C]MDJ1635753.1 hypothetical protein [Rhizobium rhizogenes]WEO66988.1 hypothetical protein G6L54_009580 [Rhizobium rhizogenes]